jgi:hypothetical protein
MAAVVAEELVHRDELPLAVAMAMAMAPREAGAAEQARMARGTVFQY